jgi:ParB-like chromosome segregation protein Spo0J
MLKFNLEIKYVKTNKIEANDYNPNFVSNVNMELLKTSIEKNGFCYPIIVIYDESKETYIIVDGYHRYKILKEFYKSDVVPVIILESKSISDRMTSTIQFNRARGTHKIDGDANIVITLSKNGMNDEDICKYLGMCQDEVLRLKQSTGLKEAFIDHEFSNSWDELKEKLIK